MLEGDVLYIEQLAKYGEMLVDGEVYETYEAHNSCEIKIRPFTVIYEKPEASEEVSVAAEDDSTEHLPATVEPFNADEKTSIGEINLALRLQVYYPTGEEETIRVTGEQSVAGREASCDIYLRDDHISRRHFEIIKQSNLYYLRDLGSSNGTYLNDHKVSAEKPEVLKSEDQIKIKGLKINILHKC